MTVNLKAKKERIISIIMSMNDEAAIDEIEAKILGPFTKLPEGEDVLKYFGHIEDKLDIEKLAREQNYTGIDLEEMKRLTAELDIPQTTEELLAMLD